jgi:hypothetical protein
MIQNGTYDLVSITVHPGDGGGNIDVFSPVHKTVVISNATTTSADIQQADQQGDFLERQTGTLAISGHSLTFAQSCPAVDAGAGNASGTADFTYSGITMTVFETHGGGAVVVEVYQKRS